MNTQHTAKWPEFESHPNLRLDGMSDGKSIYAVRLREPDYNHAKLCVAACEGTTPGDLQQIAGHGGWNHVSMDWKLELEAAQNKAEAFEKRIDNITELATAAGYRVSKPEDVFGLMRSEIDGLKVIVDKLKDPATVYVNMLRGQIAIPREFEHLRERVKQLESVIADARQNLHDDCPTTAAHILKIALVDGGIA